MSNLTPMMQQYMEIKEEYKDCILFFRLGDFYEMFFEDAIVASKELEITLTQRGVGLEKKAPMCGIPYHVSDNYISKLIDRGYKVAICEQVEDPKDAKGIVKRDVIKVITPGTVTDEKILRDKSNNYLLALYYDGLGIGLAYVDNSTGEVYATSFKGSEDELLSFSVNEISKISPREIICNRSYVDNKKTYGIIKNNLNPYLNVYDNESIESLDLDNIFTNLGPFAEDKIKSIKDPYISLASGKLFEYLSNAEKRSLDHINDIRIYDANNYMILDFSTRSNLEIDQTIISKDKKGSILGFLDRTATSMGGRLLKRWLDQPLINRLEIEKRHLTVDYFFKNLIFRDDVIDILSKIYDIERLASKISSGSPNARDLISLRNSIARLPELKDILLNTGNENLREISEKIDGLEDVYQLIDKSITENPPITIMEGNLIKEGYNEELDEIRELSIRGKEWLAKLEKEEKEKTGINNLKIGFNKILGYYFEITKANIGKAPDYFIRKQTLTNSERYFTEELKNMEAKIIDAEDRLLGYEYEIFIEIREAIKLEVERIQRTSNYIAELDVLTTFASIAYENNFVRPSINNDGVIDIKNGRHPVVESNIEANLFVANDSYLDLDKNMVQIITGPNMAGKSTYMRQVAIISLLTQIGSFVPADSANMSIVDRIFTRIGAADNLSQGQSTFMVEMNEVANIVKSATKDSLIILDEVGRGTSTYDGLSIAWSLIEYIATTIRAKTLFATHYHELTDLSNQYDNIKNLTILAEEKGQDIVFLRKVVEGSTNRSYGIEVARLAGINDIIVGRANEILASIEHTNKVDLEFVEENKPKQIDFNSLRKDSFIESILRIDPDNLKPREALDIVYNLVEDARSIRGNEDE